MQFLRMAYERLCLEGLKQLKPTQTSHAWEALRVGIPVRQETPRAETKTPDFNLIHEIDSVSPNYCLWLITQKVFVS